MSLRSMVSSVLVCLAVTALSFVPSGLSAQQQDGLEVLERAAARYEGVTALCADFVQHLEVTLLGDERTGVGRMCQSQPDRFGMRFSEPAGDLVVIDGESIWLYYPSNDDKVVIRLQVTGTPGGYDLHREFLERPAEKYDVTLEASEMVDGHATHRLRLTPKERSSYRSAVLWIDTGMPVLRRIRINEDNETVRTITLSNVELGPTDLDPGFFTFAPPPGADVISR